MEDRTGIGKLLVSGDGKENTATIISYVAWGIGLPIAFFVVVNIMGEMYFFGNILPLAGRFLVIFLVAVGSIVHILSSIGIYNSAINVYENGVSGKGLSKYFNMGDVRTFTFMLTYEQVSVDVNGKWITIHGPGTSYKVCISNAAEIQQAIYQQQQRLKDKSSNPQ
ncbi:MAG: hypothetical protein FWG68_00620 [Defluviitaleaceae bacterium]|nr:hypothetical protein [Defluviitaleaceae bacterium]